MTEGAILSTPGAGVIMAGVTETCGTAEEDCAAAELCGASEDCAAALLWLLPVSAVRVLVRIPVRAERLSVPMRLRVRVTVPLGATGLTGELGIAGLTESEPNGGATDDR